MAFHRSLQEACVLASRWFVQTHQPSLADTHRYTAGRGTLTASGTQEPSWPCLAVAKEGRDSGSYWIGMHTLELRCIEKGPNPHSTGGKDSGQVSVPCTPARMPQLVLVAFVKLKVCELCRESKSSGCESRQ